MMFLTTLDIEL